jgi:hypothetical protein
MKTRIPNLISILIFTLVTSLAWVGFSVVRAFTSKPAPVLPPEITEELSPILERTTIEKIKNRIFLSEGEIPQTQIQVSPTPTPTATPVEEEPTETPDGSSSSTPAPTETPTPEGGATQ